MPPIDRRQGLWMLAGTAATLGGVGIAARALARPAPPSAPGGRTLVLVEKKAGRVGFYALPDGRRVGSVTLGEQPHEIASDGRHAYVGGYGVASWQAPGAGGHVVWMIDLAARRLVRTIDLSPHGRLHGVRVDGAGRLYVLGETDSVLARFDTPATDAAPSRLVPVGGARSHYLVVRRDGTRAYVADTMSGAVIMVNPEDMGVAPVRRRIGVAAEGLALSRDEAVLYAIDRPAGVIHALDAATLAPRAQRPMRGEAVRVVTLPDGRLVVSNTADRSLSRLDPVTLAEEARLPLPAAAPGLNLAGDTLYVSLENDRVAIVDVATWAITGGFATGAAPDSAVVV
jgi:sugar lactone lactonase YvrE